MHRFLVTVRTEAGRHEFAAIAQDSASLVSAAIDQFGPCSVFVKVMP